MGAQKALKPTEGYNKRHAAQLYPSFKVRELISK